jgi:hypothetical protein
VPKLYENKADHNQDFLDSINNDYPESFFDWKVTIQFYVGLHRCYCVLINNDVPVTSSHQTNINNLKTIDEELSRKLFLLYKNSRQARYDGFLNQESMDRINKINFITGDSNLKLIIKLVSNYYPNSV